MAKRKGSLRPKQRFEVFKRDRFTCLYCGRRVPEVILQVDHVVPVSAGGTDDPENLLTSCEECNLGKGASPVDKRVCIRTQQDQEERRLQLQSYQVFQFEQQECLNASAAAVLEHWERLCPRAKPLMEPSIRRFLKKLDFEEVIDALDITATKPINDWGRDRYCYAVLHAKLRENGGEW